MRRALAGLLVGAVVSMPGGVAMAGVGSGEPVAARDADRPDPAERGGPSLRALEVEEQALVEYDPWERFNQKTFAFNHGLDSHVLKPVARAYDKVVPSWVQRAVTNAAANSGSIRRIVSTAFQGRFNDMGQEFGRLFINTVFGLGGFVNAAPSFGVKEGTTADMGQTFGVWGAGPGPYVVLPFLPSLTLRDTVGLVFDTALDPITWVAPIAAAAGATGEKTVNTRSLNLDLYENVEETTLDLYGAVENAYLQRRDKAVREGRVRGLFGRSPGTDAVLSGPGPGAGPPGGDDLAPPCEERAVHPAVSW